MDDETRADAGGPFHEGELAVQRRAGSPAKIGEVGRRMIRDFMPEQHRDFFAALPLFVIAAPDARGRPWATALAGPPGFLISPDPRRLHVAARPPADDPLAAALVDGAAAGGLGIELHTRRRNRVNGRVERDPDGRGFTIRVEQSFGNCPQYIQRRPLRPAAPGAEPAVRAGRLDGAAAVLVARSDTLFVASHFAGDGRMRAHGADVSHRGGRPGFVRRADERTLEIPDYRGNFLFNTLGNLAVDPRCGLLFLDFETGDVLQLTGRAEILWHAEGGGPAPGGADRTVRFETEEAVRRPGALPLRGELVETAPDLRGPAGGGDA